MNASVLSVKQLTLWIKPLISLAIVWVTVCVSLTYAADRPKVRLILVDDLTADNSEILSALKDILLKYPQPVARN
jgi:hypothetical protein